MTRKTLFAIRLDGDVLARLRERERETGATAAEHVRRAIRAYLGEAPPRPRVRPMETREAR